MSCAARRQNDQMACGPCAVVWDINDPEPPSCGLECIAAADSPRDEDADKAGWQPNIHGGRGEAPIDDDFDAHDMPHTLMEFID